MRNVVVNNIVSLDGYFADHGGNPVVLTMNPDNRSLSADNREISRVYNSIAKVVVSDSLEVAPHHPWASTTTVG